MSDEYGSVEDLNEAVEAQETQDQQPETEETEQAEQVFVIDGNPTPYSQVAPEQVKEWYDAHTNKANWQKENTRRSQDLATEREDWQKQRPLHEKQLDEYAKWERILNTTPGLYENVQKYLQQRQGAQQPAQQQTQRDPETQRELSEIKEWRKSVEQEREDGRRKTEREDAIEAIKKMDANIDMEQFQTFMNQNKFSSLKDLYTLFYYKWLNDNRSNIEKEAERKVVDNIQNKRSAAIEKGSASSSVSVPTNVNLDKSFDDLFDDFEEEQGVNR